MTHLFPPALPRHVFNAVGCLTLVCALAVIAAHRPILADDETLASDFPAVQAILLNQCQSCHAGETHEGELDLQRYQSIADVRTDLTLWQRLATAVRQNEMPPPDSPQLNDSDRSKLLQWIDDLIAQELQQAVGDPGPTILRRLNTAEYTYTIQDLTGVGLQPAREFPIEGAAGEGFINAGEALSMSPALLQKYLDAAKTIANHAVLTPDGARFSISDSRRDWEEELLTPIRQIYARYTSGRTDAHYLDQWSGDPRRLLENDGRIDLTPYFTALLTHRDTLLSDPTQAGDIAQVNGLNAKYFKLMVQALSEPQPKSILLDHWRRQGRRLAPHDAAHWVEQVTDWQKQLFKFQSVSHLGLIQPWQAAVSPLQTQLHVAQPIPSLAKLSDRQLEITIGCAGEQSDDDQVVLIRPRIEFTDRPAIMLSDLPRLKAALHRLQTQELVRFDEYLVTIAKSFHGKESVQQSDRVPLNPQVLARLADFLGLRSNQGPALSGHFLTPHTQVAGQAAIQAWSTDELPVLLANRSDQDVSFSTLTVPAKSVTLHPTPDKAAAVAWRCPQSGEFSIHLEVTDQDDKCGNGIQWSLQQRSSRTPRLELAAGQIDSGTKASWDSVSPITLALGDVIQLVISARDRNHVCDTTGVHLVLRSVADGRKWDFAADVVDDLLSGNPHHDSYGNQQVWHFLSPPDAAETSAIPVDSLLARWRHVAMDSPESSELLSLANTIREQLVVPETNELPSADLEVRRILLAWQGPLDWAKLAQQEASKASDDLDWSNLFVGTFGSRGGLQTMDDFSLRVTAPARLVCSLPGELVNGGQLVFDVALADSQASDGSVQVQVSVDGASSTAKGQMDPSEVLTGVPILIGDNEQAKDLWERAFTDFRLLFPAAMCHAQIVPIDAVVTLVLFHREDEPLCRLMLSDDESDQLNHLWRELHFVSEDALRMETSLEQILEFSTQDADPKFFDPVRQPIADRATQFRADKLAAEPRQLEWLLRFAARAYRRPLQPAETERLQSLYHELRAQSIEHDTAIRQLIARVLSSLPFLYRLESSLDQTEPCQLPAYQLATRLSYFLWSSMPDESLVNLASEGKLLDPDVQRSEVTRMLQDSRHRRLATEFLCQWMHLRDFDRHDEKSEQAFPEFSALRSTMYEETLQFFMHLIREDRSILELLNADYAILNETLAQFYGIQNVEGMQWRKVEQAASFGRGGVLTLSAVLASQSGASRTSPVLRGNWITETLLGERLPKPPKDVPIIPDGDGTPQTLTVRQLVERHTAEPSCAKCHQRIDPFGLALERYDGIGRIRDTDAGQPIDCKTRLPDGTVIEGVDGVRAYLLQERQDQFVRQFCRKLLGFALGRSLVLGDELLLRQMEQSLSENDYRFSSAIQTIVSSQSFQMIRGRQFQPHHASGGNR